MIGVQEKMNKGLKSKTHEPHEALRNFIKSLNGAELAPDDLSEEAYFYTGRNFVHFHGPRHVDIRLSLPQQKEALESGKARKHHFAPQAGWVSSPLTAENLEIVKGLVKQAYDYSVEINAKKGEEAKK